MDPRQLFGQFTRFLGVGVAATGIQYAVLIAAVEWHHADPALASSSGFALSALGNYLLNYHLTFGSKAPHLMAAGRFAIVASAGLGINALLMWTLTHRVDVPYVVAQVVTTAVAMVWNFCGNAFWSFATPPWEAP